VRFSGNLTPDEIMSSRVARASDPKFLHFEFRADRGERSHENIAGELAARRQMRLSSVSANSSK